LVIFRRSNILGHKKGIAVSLNRWLFSTVGMYFYFFHLRIAPESTCQ